MRRTGSGASRVMQPPDGALVVLPSELAPGDLVEHRSSWFLVEGEPLTMHRGLSPFDEFELLVGVRLRSLEPVSEVRLVTWHADDQVRMRSPEPIAC